MEMKDYMKYDKYFEEELKELADSIELYIDELENIMIIPKEIMNKEGNKILENIELAKKLVRKIRKGKLDMFKDPEDWDNLYMSDFDDDD